MVFLLLPFINLCFLDFLFFPPRIFLYLDLERFFFERFFLILRPPAAGSAIGSVIGIGSAVCFGGISYFSRYDIGNLSSTGLFVVVLYLSIKVSIVDVSSNVIRVK